MRAVGERRDGAVEVGGALLFERLHVATARIAATMPTAEQFWPGAR